MLLFLFAFLFSIFIIFEQREIMSLRQLVRQAAVYNATVQELLNTESNRELTEEERILQEVEDIVMNSSEDDSG